MVNIMVELAGTPVIRRMEQVYRRQLDGRTTGLRYE